jgi:hypothetical protein
MIRKKKNLQYLEKKIPNCFKASKEYKDIEKEKKDIKTRRNY